jgi:hypothetical protein
MSFFLEIIAELSAFAFRFIRRNIKTIFAFSLAFGLSLAFANFFKRIAGEQKMPFLLFSIIASLIIAPQIIAYLNRVKQ